MTRSVTVKDEDGNYNLDWTKGMSWAEVLGMLEIAIIQVRVKLIELRDVPPKREDAY